MTQAVSLASLGNGPAFSAYNSGTLQAISNATDTAIQFQTEYFDLNGGYNNTGSTVTLNGVSVPAWSFGPNVAGYYQINANLTFSPNGTGVRFIKIFKNATLVSTSSVPGNAADWMASSASAIVYLNGTSDHVTIYAWQNSATTLSFANAGWNNFSASLVRGA
jgi:hypothetical protein